MIPNISVRDRTGRSNTIFADYTFIKERTTVVTKRGEGPGGRYILTVWAFGGIVNIIPSNAGDFALQPDQKVTIDVAFRVADVNGGIDLEPADPTARALYRLESL